MHPLEFTVELNGTHSISLPSDVAARLPKSGRARIIVFTSDDTEDASWQNAAYEQFLREDPPADGVYESLQ